MVNLTFRPTIKVCICGSGNAGIAIAADLALLEYEVNLFELPEFKNSIEPIKEEGGIIVTGNTYSGKTGKAKLNKITTDASEAVKGTELIMVTVLAMAHEVVLKVFSAYLEEQQVILSNTRYWASLRFRDLLWEEGVLEKVTMAEANTMPYLSEKKESTHVHIFRHKKIFSNAGNRTSS